MDILRELCIVCILYSRVVVAKLIACMCILKIIVYIASSSTGYKNFMMTIQDRSELV